MGHSIQILVHFGQLYDLIKKTYFWIIFLKKLQVSMRKPNFLRQAISKNPDVLHSRYTWDTPYRVWFTLDNSMT